MNETTVSLIMRSTGEFSNKTTTLKSNHREGKDNQVVLFIVLTVTTVVCVVMSIGLIVWLLKRSRMDKLRHHLMPLYSFDPSDSGGDWETDLLSQEVRLRGDSTCQPSSPILKLSTMHSEL